jgi:DNA-3-methyladenine glycosylase I
MIDEKKRCAWAGTDPLYVRYHDEEWGVPTHDDKVLFEFLVLESAQAGLSWATILKKRENYRRAFADFDAAVVAMFTLDKIEALLLDPGIVRNRLKVTAAVHNAQCFLELQKEYGSFAAYQWQFVNNTPKDNAWNNTSKIPTTTTESDAFSKDLKKRGFRFLGSTTIYAHMQATGMVNDHTTDCFRHDELVNNVRTG